jgi:hypothetical protein
MLASPTVAARTVISYRQRARRDEHVARGEHVCGARATEWRHNAASRSPRRRYRRRWCERTHRRVSHRVSHYGVGAMSRAEALARRAFANARALTWAKSAFASRDAGASESAHVARVLSVYRRILRRARALEDPCARHYAHSRAMELFRRRADVTSARDAEAYVREGARMARRLKRTSHAIGSPIVHVKDLRALLEHAYGLRGRFRHLVKACEEQTVSTAAPRRRRPERFMLPTVCVETGETYALKYLFHALEGRYDGVDDAGMDRGESLERQMRALRLRVPTYRPPRSGENDDDIDGSGDESDDDECNHVDARGPYAWEVATASARSSEDVGPYGVGALPSRDSWEMMHLALLKTTFVPAMHEHVKHMPRRMRRVYERTFELEKDALAIENMHEDGTVDDIDVVDGRIVAKRSET